MHCLNVNMGSNIELAIPIKKAIHAIHGLDLWLNFNSYDMITFIYNTLLFGYRQHAGIRAHFVPIIWNGIIHTFIMSKWSKVYQKKCLPPLEYAIAHTLQNTYFLDFDIGILAHLRPSNMIQQLDCVDCTYFI